jgi:hypothetical protein
MSVGADIEAVCGRCGMGWHVVIAMADGRIAQVECRQCGKRHKLRAAAAPRPHRRTGETGAGARRPTARTPLVEPNLSRPPRPYVATDSYVPGDRVEHVAFGPGVVERLTGPGKVQIFFAGGSRVLVHRRG